MRDNYHGNTRGDGKGNGVRAGGLVSEAKGRPAYLSVGTEMRKRLSGQKVARSYVGSTREEKRKKLSPLLKGKDKNEGESLDQARGHSSIKARENQASGRV